jgi:5-oxoprolinase (ATP-hydrolysing) subunit A
MVDINCDMGEGMDSDAQLMPFITSANIACGYHAGNIATIRDTIALCRDYNVLVGVHPSFDDKANFGRKEFDLSDTALYRLIKEQLQLFAGIVKETGISINHVKPHGALYNMAARNFAMSSVIAKAIFDFDRKLVLYGLAGSYLLEAGVQAGLRTMSEVFADRTYQADGTLTPRTDPGALIQSPEAASQQVLQMVNEQKITATDGTEIRIIAETVCIHGDNENAVGIAKAVFKALTNKTV